MVDPISEHELRNSIELMYFAYRGFTSHADKILEEKGLGRLHHRILYFIGRNNGLSVSELIKILSISKQALNAPLRQLIEQDYVSTNTDAKDKRLKRLYLSEAGKALEIQLIEKQMQQLSEAFSIIDNNEFMAWQKIMSSLSKS